MQTGAENQTQNLWFINDKIFLVQVLDHTVLCEGRKSKRLGQPSGTLPMDRKIDRGAFEITGSDLGISLIFI